MLDHEYKNFSRGGLRHKETKENLPANESTLTVTSKRACVIFGTSAAHDLNVITELPLAAALTKVLLYLEHRTSAKTSLSSPILHSSDLATHKKQVTLSGRRIPE